MNELKIIMNGVTGRMGTNQHLIRSIKAIREQGGVELPDGEPVVPDPVLVGRNKRKLVQLADTHDIDRWRVDPDLETILDEDDAIYFDSQITHRRPEAIQKAIEAGKHVYCEKPLAGDVETAVDIAKKAEAGGIKHGIVHDKLWLPGLLKLKRLVDQGFFGEILSIQIDFGYWVFTGHVQPPNRPSWNYRKADGGGMIDDMFAHYNYILESIFEKVTAITCRGAIHIPERVDESGDEYEVTADDAAYAILELEDDIIAQISSSWTTRVKRDDLFEIQVDGTEGSAVAGLRDCHVQHESTTPKPNWNPDQPTTHDYHDDWTAVPDNREFENAFKTQWEAFIRHVVADEPFPYDFVSGARGVQLSERAHTAWDERRWVSVPELDV